MTRRFIILLVLIPLTVFGQYGRVKYSRMSGSNYSWMLPANRDTVYLAEYTALQTGVANWGSGITTVHVLNTIHNSRIRQDGSLTDVELYVKIKPASIDSFWIQIWRQRDNDEQFWDFVAHEEIWSEISADQTSKVTLDNPIDVEIGDYIGFGWDADSEPGNFLLYNPDALAASCFTLEGSAPGYVGYDWIADPAAKNWHYPIKAYVYPAPVIVGLGTSSISGMPLNRSFIEPENTTNLASSFPQQLLAYLGDGFTIQSMSNSGEQTSAVAARVTTDLVNLKPKVAIVYAGLVDIRAAIPLATSLIHWTTIINTCRNNGIYLVIILHLPADDDSNVLSQNKDTFNDSLIARANGFSDVIYVDCRPVVGQFRSGGDPGNLWDMQDGMDAGDGKHYTLTGYSRIAYKIAERLKR